MTGQNRDELIDALLVGELTPEQRQQIQELMADDEATLREIDEQMWLEPLLRDSFQDNPDEFVSRLEAAMDGDHSRSDAFATRVIDAWSARKTRRRYLGIVTGAVLLAMVFLAVLLLPDATDQVAEAAPIVRVQSIQGDVEIVGNDGSTRRATPGIRLNAGDTVTTAGESAVTVSVDDGSIVTLTRDASLTWEFGDQQRVVLNAGLARVQRSADGKPGSLLFSTAHVTVESPDTDLVLATSGEQTDVTVSRGQIRLTGADGETVQVSDGECGVAKRGSLEVRRGLATPDSWSEDFEDGIPNNWRQGKLVDSKLPAGSRVAVGTKVSHNEDGDPCHQIWTYSQWEHGLAVVHDDTCLNFVYRFLTPDEVQVMTLLRSPVPESPVHDVQILRPMDVPADERWWRVQSGQWYTVSIPLSRLSNPVSLEHAKESYIATAFNFRPQNDACGLVIDRMWIERGTSEKIEFRPFNGKPQ